MFLVVQYKCERVILFVLVNYWSWYCVWLCSIICMEIIVKFHLVALLVLDNFLPNIIFFVKCCELTSITDIPYYIGSPFHITTSSLCGLFVSFNIPWTINVLMWNAYACMKISNKTFNHASPKWNNRCRKRLKLIKRIDVTK